MIVKWLEDAICDLNALREYIAQDSSINANHVAKRILNAVALLSKQPGMGRPGRISNTRELIVPDTSYIIPYRTNKKGEIEILRVFHAAMKWPYDE